MELTIQLQTEAYERLQILAKESGASVEQLATALLSEKLEVKDYLDRWSNNGIPWTSFSPEEIAETYSAAYTRFPVGDDEFALREEDSNPLAEEQ
jgi:hypothetical protein